MSYFHEDRDSKGDEVICLETHRLTDFNFYIPFFCNWNVMVFHIFQSFISTLEKISKTSKENSSLSQITHQLCLQSIAEQVLKELFISSFSLLS